MPPLTDLILPPLPGKGIKPDGWSFRTAQIWHAWRADWVTRTYGPSEIAMAVELAYLWEDAVRSPSAARWGECRQWLDRLGLTPKGKRDLRVYLSEEPDLEAPHSARALRHAPMRLVQDDFLERHAADVRRAMAAGDRVKVI